MNLHRYRFDFVDTSNQRWFHLVDMENVFAKDLRPDFVTLLHNA